MKPETEKILATLEVVSEGLHYPSESQYPFTVTITVDMIILINIILLAPLPKVRQKQLSKLYKMQK